MKNLNGIWNFSAAHAGTLRAATRNFTADNLRCAISLQFRFAKPNSANDFQVECRQRQISCSFERIELQASVFGGCSRVIEWLKMSIRNVAPVFWSNKSSLSGSRCKVERDEDVKTCKTRRRTQTKQQRDNLNEIGERNPARSRNKCHFQLISSVPNDSIALISLIDSRHSDLIDSQSHSTRIKNLSDRKRLPNAESKSTSQ